MIQEEEIKKEQVNVMLDIETCGLGEDAALLSLTMIAFKLGEEEEVSSYDTTVDLTSCYMAGMHFDTDTQAWWMKQDPMARLVLTSADKRRSIQQAMKDAYDYLAALAEEYELVMWCRGTDFDFPKLEYGIRRFVGKTLPYRYWNKRDVRTYCHTFNVHSGDVPFVGVKHSSLDDCRHQIRQVQEAYKVLCHLQECRAIVNTNID